MFSKYLLLYNLTVPVFVFITQESAEEDGWHHLVAKGFIEYIDTEEEETTMISMTISVSNKMFEG